jgi:hypothetical protein
MTRQEMKRNQIIIAYPECDAKQLHQALLLKKKLDIIYQHSAEQRLLRSLLD